MGEGDRGGFSNVASKRRLAFWQRCRSSPKQPRWYLFRAPIRPRFFCGNRARREFHFLLVPSLGLAPAGLHERLLPAIFCSPKNVTQSTAPLHPAIAVFVPPCTSRAPHHALLSAVSHAFQGWCEPLPVARTSIGIHGQSPPPVATDSGAREGYLASQLVGLRPTRAMPA